jgi:hypothetical protein
METTTAKKVFTPKQERVVVKPIMRARNPLVTDPEHEAFFLVGNATINYCLPTDTQGNLLNPFSSKEEQEWLEKELDLDLNFHKTKDNFWHDFKVKLGKSIKRLDLQNPKHYLDYLVLKANRLFIAPNGEAMNDRATYRYALVSEEFENKKSVKQADLKIEAYKAFGKLEEDTEGMKDFLKVYGKKVSPVSKKSFLIEEISKIVDNDLEGFLAVIRDKDNYEIKLLVAEAVEVGAVIKQGRKYTLPGGDNLCGPGEQPTMAHVVEYLKAPANQDILTLLQTRVKTAKD